MTFQDHLTEWISDKSDFSIIFMYIFYINYIKEYITNLAEVYLISH